MKLPQSQSMSKIICASDKSNESDENYNIPLLNNLLMS